MKLHLAMGLLVAALAAAPVVACVGSPFSSTGGPGGSSGSGAASGTGTGATSASATSASATSGMGGSTTSGMGGSTTSVMSSSVAVSSSTGGPTCAPPTTLCNGMCVDERNDPLNCGGCGNKCPLQGDTCSLGKCHCKGGGLDCDGVCTNGAYDPTNCGSCGKTCDHEQACDLGICACRPPLMPVGGGCFDTKHDPMHCGGNTVCAPGDVCGTAGTSTTACVTTTVCTSLQGTVCNGGCYADSDFQNNPFNCGKCGQVCAPTQLCVDGNCQDFTVPVMCDVTSCSGGSACCNYPGITNDTICLNGSCPN